jgi:AraC-like DNA-binding protein
MQIWESPPPVRLVALAKRLRVTNFRLHEHSFYELGIVLSGQCDWLLGRRRVSLKAGETILLKPGTLHREAIRAGEEAQLAWVGFDFTGKRPAWESRAVSTGEDFSEITEYIEIIAREHHHPGPASQTRVSLAAQSLLLLVDRHAQASPLLPKRSGKSGLNPSQINRVESAAHYFRTNLQDSLSVAQVAAYHSLCPAHFTSLFRRHHRVSPRTFLRRARVDKAMDFLRTSDLALKEVAVQCGFVDAAHLCKAFKQLRGITPRQFRTRSLP